MSSSVCLIRMERAGRHSIARQPPPISAHADVRSEKYSCAARLHLNASKKELAKKIEAATAEVDEANEVYEAAKEKAKAILEEAKSKANEILSAAKKKVREAEQKRYEAVSAFNKKFGPYTTTLTGDKAANEYNRTLKRINDSILNFWDSFWKF